MCVCPRTRENYTKAAVSLECVPVVKLGTPDLADVFCNRWDYFQETLIKPWAEEVNVWAADPIKPESGKPYDCPPDLLHMAFERAANLRAIQLINSTV